MEYFASHPPCKDLCWAAEMNSIAEFCAGRGLDPGAGTRTFSDETVCLDLIPTEPGIQQGDAMHLPFEDASFDYVVNSHLLEHMQFPRQALCEWLRVVKPGGYVACIIPNTEYTRGMNSDRTQHYHEWSPREFVEKILGFDLGQKPWFVAKGPLTWAPGEVVVVDVAAQYWSFCCVIRKVA